MKTKIANAYILQEDRGVLLRTGGPGSIIVTADEEPELVEVDTFEEAARRIGKRRLKPIEQLRVRTEFGEVDEEATETAIASHYSEQYQHLMDIAVEWAEGLECKRGQAEPVRYDGKLYNVNISHTVVDPNHTPDVTAALYTKIPEPAASGYPVWEQPSGSTDAYDTDDIVEWEEGTGKLWISTIDANTTTPGENELHGYWEPYNDHEGL